jgi:hypothetical protein
MSRSIYMPTTHKAQQLAHAVQTVRFDAGIIERKTQNELVEKAY